MEWLHIRQNNQLISLGRQSAIHYRIIGDPSHKVLIRLVSNISSYLTRSNMDEEFDDFRDETQVDLDNIMYRAIPCYCLDSEVS